MIRSRRLVAAAVIAVVLALVVLLRARAPSAEPRPPIVPAVAERAVEVEPQRERHPASDEAPEPVPTTAPAPPSEAAQPPPVLVRVLDAGGKPASAPCTFAFEDVEGIRTAVSAVGDGPGAWRVPAPPAGSVASLLIVSVAGRRFDLPLPADQAELQVQLPFAGSVSGVLVSSSGVPVVGATVILRGTAATTDERGEFVVSGLGVGRLERATIRAAHGVVTVVCPVEVSVDKPRARVRLALPPQERCSIEVHGDGVPVEAAVVSLEVTDGGAWSAFRGQTDSTGRLDFDDVPRGEYACVVAAAGFDPVVVHMVNVPRADVIRVDLERRARPILRGVVRDATGAPLPGVEVSSVRGGRTVVTTDAEGRYEIPAPQRHPSMGRRNPVKWVPPAKLTLSVAGGISITVTPGDDGYDEWTLPRVGTVRGVVMVGGRRPKASAASVVFVGAGVAHSRVQLDARGRFEWAGAPLGPGTLEVQLSSDLRGAVVLKATDEDDVDVGTIDIRPRSRIRVEFEQSGPAGRGFVSVRERGGDFHPSTSISAKGDWTTRATVLAGDVDLLVWLPGSLCSGPISTEVEAGGLAEIEFDPLPPLDLSLHLIAEPTVSTRQVEVELRYEGPHHAAFLWREVRRIAPDGSSIGSPFVDAVVRETSDEAGVVRLSRLPAGRYTASVTLDGELRSHSFELAAGDLGRIEWHVR